MTVYTLVAPAPQLPLDGGSLLKLEAVSPTTGLAVTGVTLTRIAIYGKTIQVTALTDEIPLLTPEEMDGSYV